MEKERQFNRSVDYFSKEHQRPIFMSDIANKKPMTEGSLIREK